MILLVLSLAELNLHPLYFVIRGYRCDVYLPDASSWLFSWSMAVEVARWWPPAAREICFIGVFYLISAAVRSAEMCAEDDNIACRYLHFNISFPNVLGLAILKKVNPENTYLSH